MVCFKFLISLIFLLILISLPLLTVKTGLVIIISLIIIVIINFKNDLSNPAVWLPPFIFLYTFSVIILDYLGIRDCSFKKEIFLNGYIAIIGWFLGSFLMQSSDSGLYKRNLIAKKIFNLNELKPLKTIFWFFSIIIIIVNYSFLNSGITSKGEASLHGDFYYSNYLFRLFILFYLIIIVDFDKKNKKYLVTAFLLSFITAINIGERDFLFTIALITVLHYFNYQTPKNRIKYIFFGILSLPLIPLMGILKNVTVADKFSMLNNYSVFTSIFSGEFISAGRNLETILKNSWAWDYSYGTLWINDLLRGILPPFILKTSNSVGWFNNTFHSDRVIQGQGLGFGLIPEAYISFSYYGVFAVYFILSLFINKIYIKAKKSNIYYVIYLLLIPIIIYSQRGDLSTIISPWLKQILIPFVAIILITYTFRNLNYEKTTRNL